LVSLVNIFEKKFLITSPFAAWAACHAGRLSRAVITTSVLPSLTPTEIEVMMRFVESKERELIEKEKKPK